MAKGLCIGSFDEGSNINHRCMLYAGASDIAYSHRVLLMKYTGCFVKVAPIPYCYWVKLIGGYDGVAICLLYSRMPILCDSIVDPIVYQGHVQVR